MAVYVDDAGIYFEDKSWYHLVSDDPTDEELHDFAQRLGLRRHWYQGDHYDITYSKRLQALERGAISVTLRDLVQVLYDSGKRLKPDLSCCRWSRWAGCGAADGGPSAGEGPQKGDATGR